MKRNEEKKIANTVLVQPHGTTRPMMMWSFPFTVPRGGWPTVGKKSEDLMHENSTIAPKFGKLAVYNEGAILSTKPPKYEHIENFALKKKKMITIQPNINSIPVKL